MHLHWCIIGKERSAAANDAPDLVSQRLKQRCRAANPIGHGRAVQIDPFAGIDLALAVEWKVIGILAHKHMRQKARAGPATLDRTRRQRRLHNRFAAPAGFARADNPVHDEASRHILKLFRDILAEGLQLAAAARAVLTRGQNFVMPVQMVRQRLATVLARRLVFSGRRLGLRLFRCGLGNCFVFLEGQVKLIQALRL